MLPFQSVKATVCPAISAELIAYLEKMFPDAAVDPAKQDPAVAFGKASVVRHLKMKHQEQSETVYVSP